MDKLEAELRQICADAPHWQQIQLQVFWYGMIMWAMDCADKKTNLLDARSTVNISEIIAMADGEPSSWPTDWLEPFVDKFIATNLSAEQVQDWLETLDTLFRDCIPTDLDVYSTLANGEVLTQEQWTRLYDSVAFLPPTVNQPTDAPSHIAHTMPTVPTQALEPVHTVPVTEQKMQQNHLQQKQPHPKPKYMRAKTRRTHGRRAITPIRGRRAHTRHHHTANPIQIVKVK
jgi:hypothetical protein